MNESLRRLKQRLVSDNVFNSSTQIASIINVNDLKKLQSNYLVATLDGSLPGVYIIKINEKNEIKIKASFKLSEIKFIKLFVDDLYKRVEFQFDDKKIYDCRCENQQDLKLFLSNLWKLAEQFLRQSDRPKFENFEVDSSPISFKNTSISNIIDDFNETYEDNDTMDIDFNIKDEESLIKLMSECDFATSDTERFISKLKTELYNLETSNIESIMNSEESSITLLNMLDKAVDEIDKIDQRLQIYEDKICAVGDAVKKVGNEDNFIQIQETNQQKLLDELEDMIGQLDYSEEYQKVLRDCDLTTKAKVDRCVQAANALLSKLNIKISNGLMKMKAYDEQKRIFDSLKFQFGSQCAAHIKNAIGYSVNKHHDSLKIVDNSLNSLPSHKPIYDDLIIYKDLIPWLQKSGAFLNEQNTQKFQYDVIKNAYVDSVRKVYLNELGPFFYCAKSYVSKLEKPKTSSVTSMENIRNQIQKTIDKTYSDMFQLRIDSASKTNLKKVFNKLLDQISQMVQLEESFCVEFFNDQKNILNILSQIYQNSIEEQIKIIIESIIKIEPVMSLFFYAGLLYRTLVCTQKTFIHQRLVTLLRFSKEKNDEYINQIKESIKEYKVNKREKISVLKYVTYFEEFVKDAEQNWEPIKKDMYEKLCMIYQGIINDIFNGIELVATESQKTPSDVVRFQNYHQMNHIMRSINGLKDTTKYARDQFNACKQAYIREHFGRPLEKLHNFFEKVEQRVERGIKYEDISYQVDLSVNNLREIVKEYPAKEIKKGLDSLYRKVEKHLAENSSLLQVIWRDMSDEFIRQYENYEQLILKCYPGQRINLEFTKDEICRFFQEIAQSH